MFDSVHKHKRLAQVILALLIIPFAFVGVDYYFQRDGSVPAVATVAGREVSRAEFDELMRQQQDRMRAAMGRGYDPAMFDNPEVRYQLLQQLIAERVLRDKARSEHFRVSDAELARAIADIEPFKVDGKFSGERYRELLASQGMSPAMFEARLREDLLTAPLSEPLAYFLTWTTYGTWLPGDERGWVADEGGDVRPPDPVKERVCRERMTEPPFVLTPEQRRVVETTVAVDTPATGDGVNYVQGGIIVYGDDGNYVRLTSNSIFDTRQTEFGKEVSPQPAGAPNYGNMVVGPVGDRTTLRIVHRVVDGLDQYTAYTSDDGRHFVRGGTWTADLGAHPRIGLISLGGAGFTSTFDDLRVSTVRSVRG